MAARMHDAFRGFDYYTTRLTADVAQLIAPSLRTRPLASSLGAGTGAGDYAGAGTSGRDGASGVGGVGSVGESSAGGGGGMRAAAYAAELAVLRVELARERAATKAALTSVRSKEQALQELAQSSAASQVEIVRLREEMEEKETVIRQLGDKFVEVQQGNAASSVERDELNAKLAGQRREVAALRRQLKEAKAATSAADARLAGAESRAEQAARSAEDRAGEVSDHAKTIKSLRADVGKLNDQVSKLTKDASSASSAAARDHTRGLADLARKKDAEIQSLTAKLKVANRIVETTKGTQNALDAKLAGAREEVSGLQEELERRSKQLEKERSERLAAEKKASEASLKAEELGVELSTLRDRHDKIEAARMASEAMNESLRQEKEGQEGRLRALELQVTQLKDNAAEAEAAAHKAKALVGGLNNDKVTLATYTSQMQSKLKVVVKEVKQARRGRDIALAECAKLRGRLRDTEEHLSEVETQLEVLQGTQEEAQRAEVSLRGNIRTLQDELQAATQGFSLCSRNLRVAEAQCMQYEDRASFAIEHKEREEEFRRLTGGWIKQLVLSPPPPVPLNDPIIMGVLQSWTTDQRKIAYVQKWMADIVKGKNLDNKKVHKGLELAKLTKEVRDGFLMLIIPLLKQRPDVSVQVLTREHQEVRTDMRVKVSKVDPRRDRTGSSSPGSVASDATFRTRDYDRLDTGSTQGGSERRRRSLMPGALVTRDRSRTSGNAGIAVGDEARRRYSSNVSSSYRMPRTSPTGTDGSSPRSATSGAGVGAGAGSASLRRLPIPSIAEDSGTGSDDGRSNTGSGGMSAARRAFYAAGGASNGTSSTARPTSLTTGSLHRSHGSGGSGSSITPTSSGSSRRRHSASPYGASPYAAPSRGAGTATSNGIGTGSTPAAATGSTSRSAALASAAPASTSSGTGGRRRASMMGRLFGQGAAN